MKILAITLITFIFFTVVSAGTTNAQTNGSDKKQAEDQPLKITAKPRVELGDCPQAAGTARLKSTFDKTGKITAVEIVSSSGCRDFDNNAVRAAKRIKFKPAIKNGEPVTVVKTLEYSFSKSF